MVSQESCVSSERPQILRFESKEEYNGKPALTPVWQFLQQNEDCRTLQPHCCDGRTSSCKIVCPSKASTIKVRSNRAVCKIYITILKWTGKATSQFVLDLRNKVGKLSPKNLIQREVSIFSSDSTSFSSPHRC